MHQTRAESPTKWPIERKGTKYIARPLMHSKDSVPLVVALRDILKLAKTSTEVKSMIHRKLIKLNGKEVREYKQSILLFNILEADKPYILSLSPTGKFTFIEAKNSKSRFCKVTGKKLLGKDIIQLNLHDGTNVISKDKININDTLELDFSGKILKHKLLEKGAKGFVILGKYSGSEGKINSVSQDKVSIELKGGSAELEKSAVMVI